MTEAVGTQGEFGDAGEIFLGAENGAIAAISDDNVGIVFDNF